MWRWYRDAANWPPSPARVSLKNLTAERAEIYVHVPPPGRPIQIYAAPFPVDDNIPGEKEIAKAVLRMQLHRSGGLSSMRPEHLKMWLLLAIQEEDSSTGNWEKVFVIIQATWRGGEFAASCAWQTVVMIPKGGSTDFRGIGLVVVLWKAIYGIINHQMLSSIHFHDVLHGFCAGRGTGTTTHKAKQLHQLISIRETFLHSIFFYLRKAYNDLDRDRCLDILVGYGVGHSKRRILRIYRARLQMAAKVGRNYGSVFQSHRGVTWGYPLSPKFFNVVVDAVIRQ